MGNKQNVIYQAEETKSHGENMQEENTKLFRTAIGFLARTDPERSRTGLSLDIDRPVLTRRVICFHPTRLLWTGLQASVLTGRVGPGRALRWLCALRSKPLPFLLLVSGGVCRGAGRTRRCGAHQNPFSGSGWSRWRLGQNRPSVFDPRWIHRRVSAGPRTRIQVFKAFWS